MDKNDILISTILEWMSKCFFKSEYTDSLDSGVKGYFIGHRYNVIVFNNGIIVYVADNSKKRYSMANAPWHVVTRVLPDRCIKDDKVIKQIR